MTLKVKVFEDISLPVSRGVAAHASPGEDGTWHISPELMALIRQLQIGGVKLEEVD